MISKNLITGIFVSLAFNIIVVSLYGIFGEVAVLDFAFRVICSSRIIAFFDRKDEKERGD